MDTPEQVEARRSVFARFGRLKIIKEEKTRGQVDEKKATSSDRHTNLWNPGVVSEAWRQQQFEYARPYLEEYERGVADFKGSLAPGGDAGEASDNSKDNDDTASCTTSSSQPGALITRLIALRGRARKIGARALDNSNSCADVDSGRKSPQSSIATRDFDVISTVVPPTEIETRPDLNSNVSAIELRNRYFSGYRRNTKLPIYNHRSHIINSINSYSVVIVEGATGCGKTTQVPLYILEDRVLERASGSAPVIYVTQPRRIAARSIAERVCSEHDWTLGSLVGYQVGLEKVAGPDTILIFCTAGVLLQKIIQEKSLKNYTHIIIDEAHERDADTDLLLMMIRKLMLSESPVFRLIIMSATMDIDKLRSYFTFRTNYGHQAVTTPSYVKIGDTKTTNDVQIVYFDKLNHLFDINDPLPDIDLEEAELLDCCLNAAVKIIVDVIPHLDNFTDSSNSTLVFLPGLSEISKLDRLIRACPGADDHLEIIPLHSCIASDDQLKVFKPCRPGCRKVILATNIAESSITVSDIGFIIDFCLTKVLQKDHITRFPVLKLQWSTQDKCIQRAGRTGRCCPGKVFRMVPYAVYRAFDDYAKPELLVAPLELSVLRVKSFNMGEIQGLFAVVMDPPPFDEIRTAVLELKQIGALSSTYKGKISDIDGDLTALGKVISSLPIDVHLSKLIVVSQVFDVLEDAIIVAACLSTNRSVVKYLYQDPLESYDRKLDWANGSYSDLFVSLDVYREFSDCKSLKGKSDRWLATWCAKRALDERKLHDIDAMVQEIKTRLEYLNISCIEQPNRERNVDEDNLMLKVAFCAAFYPNYFLTDKLDEERISKDLCGMDPRVTVVMHGIPTNQVPLYKSRIEAPIKTRIDPDFDFIADVSRALLVFKSSPDLPEDQSATRAIHEDGIIQPTGSISRSVYRALKLGEHLELYVREYKNGPALERMDYYNNYRLSVHGQFGSRLQPYLLRLVDTEEECNNERLIQASDEEYRDMINGAEFYIDVPFNRAQDELDLKILLDMEHTQSRPRLDTEEDNHLLFESRTHRVRGPDSPIRMMFRSILVKSRGFSVDIDPSSVNSILLDTDYKSDRRQMLLAASVAQNKRNRVMARDTTLMPNIRGLPTLMALLFAQYYRLVYNNELNCFAGAIFGIGWDQEDVPLDRDYEVDLGFDVHITGEDIELINMARQKISQLLKNEVRNQGKPRAVLQEQLRTIILLLMRKRRYPIQELDISSVNLPNFCISTGSLFTKDQHNLPEDFFEPLDESKHETRAFLPIVKYTRNYTEIELYDRIRRNLEELNDLVESSEKVPEGGVKCLLCGNGASDHFIRFYTIMEHLESERHRATLREFEVFEERARRRSEQLAT